MRKITFITSKWIRVFLLWPAFAVMPVSSGVIDDALSATLQAQITQPDPILVALTYDWTYLERFYALRHYEPVWVRSSGPTPRASIVRQYLHVADQDGLNKQAFHLAAIEGSWHKRSTADLVTLDILLSDALLRYAQMMRYGQTTPLLTDSRWHIAQPEQRPVSLLKRLVASDDLESALQSLAPAAVAYRGLQDALARYRRLAAAGGWPPLHTGKTLRQGMHHPQVAVLRKRLMLEGDLQDIQVSDRQKFDARVKFAVERFQVHHGLKMDGVVGTRTREAMNVPVADRIRQIELNMERWRWLPRKLGKRYLIVNSAGYELTAFEQGRPRFSMWVVIGRTDRQTPELKGVLHTVVFNPYWTVPITIAVEDLIPAQTRNPHYLQRKKIRVYANLAKKLEVDPGRVHWSRFNKLNFPYVLRQDPGPYNPLGRYKFLFSNKFDIYLHDTPTRRLFNRKQRTFSSGCIRVENPLQLASFLLEDMSGWDTAQIRAAVDTGKTRDVKLARALPIYLLYLTAWVGPDSSVYFYPDVYARDKGLAACLFPGEHAQDGTPAQCLL